MKKIQHIVRIVKRGTKETTEITEYDADQIELPLDGLLTVCSVSRFRKKGELPTRVVSEEHKEGTIIDTASPPSKEVLCVLCLRPAFMSACRECR